jgi:hypothetical protein
MTMKWRAQISSLSTTLDHFRRFGLPLVLAIAVIALLLGNIQQSYTIRVQQQLIRSLFQDSLELSARRMQETKARTADFKVPSLEPVKDPARSHDQSSGR